MSLFSTPTNPGPFQILCVNPAALSGGSGPLDAYFRTVPFPGPTRDEWRPVPAASTPWVEYPGLYAASCQQANGATFLQINDIGKPTDRRARVSDTTGAPSGLHNWDVNLAFGNLIMLVRHETAAYHR